MITIKKALLDATNKLKQHVEYARLDAEVLLSHILQKNRVYLIAHHEEKLTIHAYESFIDLINQRLKGTPVAYLVGYKEFWSLKLKVTPDTLIPRPDTEILVAHALDVLPTENITIIDLGTGSGAIAIALASERPNWNIVACDQSIKALKIAAENASALQIPNIQFIQSSWFDEVPEQMFDAIISNPPYIAKDDVHLKNGDVRFEPLQALVSGDDGLCDMIHIASVGKARLRQNGYLMFEHGFDQKELVQTILKQQGYQAINTLQDYQNHDRVTSACYSSANVDL